MNVYGIISNGVHIDVCLTEIGAKRYATKNGYNCVSIRFNCGYNVRIVATKNGKKWINQ